MSRVEVNKGVLIPVEWSDIIADYPEAFEEDLAWTTDSKYEKFRGKFYKIAWEIEGGEPEDGFANVKIHDTGNIEFHTQHYNGGAHWTEVVDWELEKQANK